MVEIAKLVGREVDIPMLEKRIEERKAATVAAYYNAWDGNFIGAFQGANAFAVDIGIGDERTYRNMVKYYDRLGRFDTGIFGTEIVSRVLFEHGDAELAVKLLTSNDEISFEGMRRNDGTTLWEYWPQKDSWRSYNHPMFGAVVAHLFDYLLGIGQEAGCVGYEKIVIRPQLVDKLNRVSGSRHIPAGVVAVSYEKSEVAVHWSVSLPENMEALFVFDGYSRKLSSGMNAFTTTINV